MSKYSQNLLLVIGNGFDLAHGLATSYGSFSEKLAIHITEYLVGLFTKEPIHLNDTISSFINPDLLTKINYARNNPMAHRSVNKRNTIDRIFITLSNHRSSCNKVYDELYSSNLIKFYFYPHSFLSEIYDQEQNASNWFNIEQIYFNRLVKSYKSTVSRSTEHTNNLNREFGFLKTQLTNYLKYEYSENGKSSNKTLLNFFLNELELNRRLNVKVLNFNYTPTFSELYLPDISNSENIEVSHIHGELSDENSIIFGYGDDKSNIYQELINSNNDSYLKYLKTFDYIFNSNYQEVKSKWFTRINEFDIVVLGHSFGKTDKTILNELINDEKCQKIHTYKRLDLYEKFKSSKEEYTKEDLDIELRGNFRSFGYSLSRINDNDINLRNKLVPFSETTFFPYSHEITAED